MTPTTISGTGRLNPADSADPAASPPWPLAVGVLLLPAGTDATSVAEARLGLALGAYQLGYYLLDLLEVAPGAAGRWAPVEALVARSGADALVVHGASASLRAELPAALAGLPVRLLPR